VRLFLRHNETSEQLNYSM